MSHFAVVSGVEFFSHFIPVPIGFPRFLVEYIIHKRFQTDLDNRSNLRLWFQKVFHAFGNS